MTSSRVDCLTALAERVEAAAAEEQRELIILAAEQVFLAKYGDVDTEEAMGCIDRFEKMLDAEAYESAAMTLVPEGWGTKVQQLGHPTFWTLVEPGTGREVVGIGSDFALALCAAALRALANTDTPKGGS